MAGGAQQGGGPELPASHGAGDDGFFVRIDGVASPIGATIPAIPATEDEHEPGDGEHAAVLSQLAMNAMDRA